MKESVQQALSEAVLRLLRPLVRVLLRHGMAYGSFAELARRAYVEEGFDHIAETGKRASVSSVSAVTGLTRKETKRLAESSPEDFDASMARYNRAIRVVSGWVNDARFHDERGEPAILSMEGDAMSFTSLVKEFSGDIPPAAMLSVLQSANTVAVSDGKVELLERAYVPSATPIEKLHILGTDVGELVGTIGHNLDADEEQLFFQRKVSNVLVHPDALPEFRRLSNLKSQELLEDYHSWLSAREVDETSDDTAPAYVAVGIYYAEKKPGEKPA
ncbi:MAG: DUF6502 family protein [Halioglobus sp.]